MDAAPALPRVTRATSTPPGRLPRALASRGWDVVVVGGGPAGAAAATHLGVQGRRVLLLEQAVAPGRKACGEGLFPAGLRELERLEVASVVEACGWRLDGITLSLGGARATARFGSSPGAVGIARVLLGPLLLQRARAAGVEVATGVAVRAFEATTRGLAVVVESEDGPRRIDAALVVGADGLGSRVRRAAGLDARARPRRYGLSAHVRLDAPSPATVEVHIAAGYEIYLTPIGAYEANVAVLGRRGLIGALGRPLATAFGALIAPYLRTVHLLGKPLVAGPFELRSSRPAAANVLLVGDAAGMTDPIAGQGMSLGLVTARLAAEAIDAYLASGDVVHLESYVRARARALRTSEAFSRLLLWSADHPRVAAYLLRGLRRHPGTFDRLLSVSSGEAAPSSLRPRDLLALAG